MSVGCEPFPVREPEKREQPVLGPPAPLVTEYR